MKLARYAFFPLGVLAILLGYLTLFDANATSERNDRKHTAERSSELESLVGRIDELENQLRVNRVRTQELADQQAEELPASEASSSPDAFADEMERDALDGDPEPREASYRRLQDRFAHYDRKLAEEARDPTWANEMEKNVLDMERAMQETHLPGTRLISLECRSTMCRAEFEHENLRERNLAPMLMHAQGLPRVSIMRKNDPVTDKQVSVAFLAKSDLPSYAGGGVEEDGAAGE